MTFKLNEEVHFSCQRHSGQYRTTYLDLHPTLKCKITKVTEKAILVQFGPRGMFKLWIPKSALGSSPFSVQELEATYKAGFEDATELCLWDAISGCEESGMQHFYLKDWYVEKSARIPIFSAMFDLDEMKWLLRDLKKEAQDKAHRAWYNNSLLNPA